MKDRNSEVVSKTEKEYIRFLKTFNHFKLTYKTNLEQKYSLYEVKDKCFAVFSNQLEEQIITRKMIRLNKLQENEKRHRLLTF